MLNNYITVMIF